MALVARRRERLEAAAGEAGGAESDPDLAGELAPVWLTRGYSSGSLIEVDELVSAVDAGVRSGAGASLPPVTGTPGTDAKEGS